MSDFWRGFWMLPAAIGAVATVVCLVIGGWLLLEKWFERRTAEMNYDDAWDGTFYRYAPASWVLAAPKMRRFKLGWGCTLLYTRGGNAVPTEQYRVIERNVIDACHKIDAEIKGTK